MPRPVMPGTLPARSESSNIIFGGDAVERPEVQAGVDVLLEAAGQRLVGVDGPRE
jgi:hypothetical protein